MHSGIYVAGLESNPAIMRRGYAHLLFAIERQVNIGRVDGQDRFIRVFGSAIGNRDRPALPKVRRLGDDRFGIVVLQPRSVDGTLVRSIDYDLRIELSGDVGSDLARRLPSQTVIIAYHQLH